MTTPHDQALASLPHGTEFRFVDRLVSLTPGKQGTATFQLKGDEPFLKGHFPGHPLMPGVLLIEAAAQLAGIVAQSDPDLPPLQQLKLTAVRNAKILGSATPGETLQLKAEVSGRLANLVQASATVSLGDQLICKADLVLGGEAPRPSQNPKSPPDPAGAVK